MFPDLTRDEVFMIGTQQLWLRWPRLDDAINLARIGGHPVVAAMTATWPVGCDAALARERITTYRTCNAAGTALSLVIAERHQWSRAIGLIGISVDADGVSGKLGYHVAPAYWGHGYATEAVAGLVSMTGLLTRLRVVRAGVRPDNPASMRVLEKNGFSRVGIGVFESPLKGPIDVVRFERMLRSSPVHQRPIRTELAA